MTRSSQHLASVLRRLGAAAIDLAPVLLLVIIALGVVQEIHLEMGAMALAAFLVFMTYHAAFLYKWAGETPGCRFMSIRVIAQGGMPDLSLVQSIARPCINAIWLTAFLPIAIEFRIPWLMALPAFANLVMMSLLPSRQTVADLLCRTFVVRTPPLQPHRAPAAPMFSATDAEFGFQPRHLKFLSLSELDAAQPSLPGDAPQAARL